MSFHWFNVMIAVGFGLCSVGLVFGVSSDMSVISNDHKSILVIMIILGMVLLVIGVIADQILPVEDEDIHFPPKENKN